MNKIIIPGILLVTLLWNGCFSSKEVLVLKEFNGDGIAVLNFSTQGTYLESNIGRNAADKLTDALFLKKNLRVVDRAKVNEALINMNIKTSEVLSNEEIVKLGQRLSANYLVLGRIVQTTDKEFMTSDDKMGLYITFRIIAVSNADVVGMASYNCSYKENLYKELDIAMSQIVKEFQ